MLSPAIVTVLASQRTPSDHHNCIGAHAPCLKLVTGALFDHEIEMTLRLWKLYVKSVQGRFKAFTDILIRRNVASWELCSVILYASIQTAINNILTG